MALFRLTLAMSLFVMGLAYPRMNWGGQMRAYRQFGGQIGGRFVQTTRLMQAACLVTDVNTGKELRSSPCTCGDETVACDVGPVTFGNVELAFCNTLENQTEDDLYVMKFACDEDENQCGAGSFCDIGPLAIGEDEYYLCRFQYNQDADDDDDDENEMCKPDYTLNSGYPMMGIGQQMGRGSRGRWAAAAAAAGGAGGNTPIGGQFPSQSSRMPPMMGQSSRRLMQAACLVTDVNTGKELRSSPCTCGDETVACDVGPVTFGNVELAFCNTLENQNEDDLYVMQFACDEDENQCGVGSFCDIGPLAIGEDEYYLCRFQYNQDADDENEMCKPDYTLNSGFPMMGIGQQMGRGSRGRWAAAAAAGAAGAAGGNTPIEGQFPSQSSRMPPMMGQSDTQNWGRMRSVVNRWAHRGRSRRRGQGSITGRTSHHGGRRGRF